MDILEQEFLVDGSPSNVCLLVLHGLGSDGHDMISLASEMKIGTSFTAVAPTATMRNTTINRSMPCRSWFDIISLSGEINFDELQESNNEIAHLLDTLTSRFEWVFLLGFSQGGVVALTTGLLYDKKLSGIVGISTFLPIDDSFFEQISEANRDTKILLCHGDADETLDVSLAHKANSLLKKAGLGTELKVYPHLGHSVIHRELNDISAMISSIAMPNEIVGED